MAGRFEVHVQGRLSERVRAVFDDLTVTEIPAETVLTGWSDDEDEVHAVLDRIQALGLHLVSLQQSPGDRHGGED